MTPNRKIRVDLRDLWLLRKFVFRINKLNGSVYSSENRKTIYLHRLILNAPSTVEVDHVNRDRTDNSRRNLRLCTRQQNMANIQSYNKHGFKGISFQDGKFKAHITINGRLMYLGRFVLKEDAARAYNTTAKEWFGEFAALNNIS